MAKQAHAIKRGIQSSPVKMRIVLNMIRGKRVPEALSILHFTPNHASIVAEKTLRSAVSNFQMDSENARFDVDDLFVRECQADGGAMLKRISAAPMGRAFRIRKRSNHLTIVVGDTPMNGIIPKTRRKSAAGAAMNKAPRASKVSTKAASAQPASSEAITMEETPQNEALTVSE
ncbi:MAG TPA: 50S ribosomal protein L22 [Candidatus Kapabacteria bacterium]|nr:50S ribosomal protein L22 [Candidatus Kapabacteria bacterium]